MKCVQVKLELGHRATLRDQITNDGFTHDWTVFVRGPESCNIHHFVEKVIFHLHRDFAKPKRVVKEPPYEVSESGYGSFNMAIEVYFKQKEEPKKVDFDYDLFLKTQSNVNHIRCEKLTFQNPTEEFRKKLIKAGAVGIVQPESGCLLPLTPHHYQRPSTPNLITGTSSSQGKDRKAVSLAIKAPKSTTSGSSLSSATTNTTQLKDTAPPINIVKQPEIAKSLTPTAPAKQTFLDLFGQPIKTNKNSPDPQKVKNSQSKKSSSSSNRNSSSTSAKEISRSSENIYINNQTAKDPNKSQVKEKIFSKRPASPSPDSPQVGHKKRKRSSTSSPSSHGSSRSKEGKEVDSRVADKKVNVVKSKSEKKEKIKSGGGKVVEGRPDAKSGREVVKAVKKIKQERVLASSPSLSTNSSVGSNSEVTRPTFTPPQPRTNYEGDVCGGGEESRSSTSSFSSSVHQYKGSGPLVALMAELDDEQDDQDDVLSPLSSDGSPPRTFIKQEPPQPPPSSHHKSPPDIKSSAKISHENKVSSKVKVKEEKSKETKAKKNSEQHKLSKKYAEKESSGFEPPMKPPRPVHVVDINDEYIIELQDLQRRILLLKDRKHLQQIVNVIEETGLYQVTSTTFDFDLCSLDRGTVKKLQSCLAVIA